MKDLGEPKMNKTYVINKDESISKQNVMNAVMKRGVDILGAIIGFIIFSPFFILIPILYGFGDGRGPVFFKQKRIGRNGKVFYIYKFRSMVINADKKLKEDKKLYTKYIENNYKLEPHEDPRITGIGKFLRKTSLDELPQFINVIKGEMSLVGPRPVVEEELLEYGEKKEKFLSAKPGVTGYWQVSGRSDIGYPERVDIELYYVDNQSILLDLKILVLTAIQVVMRKGAY